MIGDPTQKRESFLRHRFITDAVGHLLASYAALGMIYVIDNVSHTPSTFSHLVTLALAACFILMDYVIVRKFGNVKYFGLISLLIASLAGYVVFAIGTGFIEALRGGIDGRWIEFTFVMSPIFLIPAMIVPLIVRLMALPIVGVFRSRD